MVATSATRLTFVAESRWAPDDHRAMFVTVYGPQGARRWQAAWLPTDGSAVATAVAIASDGTVCVGEQFIP
jgi:hypothetical protein